MRMSRYSSKRNIKEFGELIRTLRVKRGMLQEDVAKAFGVAEATICRYESGERSLNSVDIFYKLASFYNVTVWEFASVLFPQLGLYQGEYAKVFPNIKRKEEEDALITVYNIITNANFTEENLDDIADLVHKICLGSIANSKRISKRCKNPSDKKSFEYSEKTPCQEEIDLGNFISSIRDKRQIRQIDMANYLGITLVDYNRKECGIRGFGCFATWVKLAQILNVSIWQLIDYRYPELHVLEKEVYSVFPAIKSKKEFETISSIIGDITFYCLTSKEIDILCDFLKFWIKTFLDAKTGFGKDESQNEKFYDLLKVGADALSEKQMLVSAKDDSQEEDYILKSFAEIATRLDGVFTRTLDSSYYQLFAQELNKKGFEAYSHKDGWIVFKVK